MSVIDSWALTSVQFAGGKLRDAKYATGATMAFGAFAKLPRNREGPGYEVTHVRVPRGRGAQPNS
jgi:hypothetical protein